MMTQEVIDELNQETPTEFHDQLLSKCKDLVQCSRTEMGRFYTNWDNQNRIYQSTRRESKKDRRIDKDDEPSKMVVPLTYAQVNTFIALMFLLITQNKRIFQLEPTGAEDHELQDVIEVLLEKDVRENHFLTLLYQWLLDVSRFGVGIWKSGWKEKTTVLQITETDVINGVEIEGETSFQQVKVDEGNCITTVSPYRFFPDTRLPLTRFQEGEFCASEDEHTKIALKQLESQGEVAGIEFIETFTKEDLHKRGHTRFSAINVEDPSKSTDMVCVTEVQVRLIPSEFEMGNGKKLGDEEFPIMYVVWYANDHRVIKVEPAKYLHDQFTYDVAQISPDQHQQLNKSLSDQCEKLQEAYDWFINSRISSVRRTLENNMVVDPMGVDMNSVESRSPVIKLKQRVGQGGIDRYIKQLTVQDVTASHVGDAQNLAEILQVVTGINDMALGQYSKGRRDATQSRAVTQGAASRPVSIGAILWEQALMPLAQKMVLNTRSYMDEEMFVTILGPDKAPLFPQFKADPITLARSKDFFVFDGTLPSEKQFLAQSLQEVLMVIIQNPQFAQILGFDPKAMLTEIYQLRGVRNLERFQQEPALPPEAQAMITQLINGGQQGAVPQPGAV
jgi:hypothetical protein